MRRAVVLLFVLALLGAGGYAAWHSRARWPDWITIAGRPRELAPAPSAPGAVPASPQAAAPSPSVAPSPSPTPTPLPVATDDDLRGLRKPRVRDRASAVERLFDRLPSEAMAREVALAERTTVDTKTRRRLECLRVWAGDAEALVAGAQRLPRDRAGYGKGLDAVQRCILEVVARRADESPEAAADALAVITLEGTDEEKAIALRGLARASTGERPRALQEALQSEEPEERAEAYRATLALGALERDPAVVEACLADPEAHQVCVEGALAAPGGIRLLAGAIAGEPEEDAHLWRLATQRGLEGALWPALVQVASDRSRPDDERRRALALLAERGDPAVAADLAPLVLQDADPLAPEARRALAALQRRRIAAAGK